MLNLWRCNFQNQYRPSRQDPDSVAMRHKKEQRRAAASLLNFVDRRSGAVAVALQSFIY